MVVWDDTRNGDHVTDGQDLRAAAVQIDELGWGGGQRIAAYGFAALAGAGLVGLVLLIAALVVRPRGEPVVSDHHAPTPSPG